MASSSGGEDKVLHLSVPLDIFTDRRGETLTKKGLAKVYKFMHDDLINLQDELNEQQLQYVHICDIRKQSHNEIYIDLLLHSVDELQDLNSACANLALQNCLSKYAFNREFGSIAGLKRNTNLILNISLPVADVKKYKEILTGLTKSNNSDNTSEDKIYSNKWDKQDSRFDGPKENTEVFLKKAFVVCITQPTEHNQKCVSVKLCSKNKVLNGSKLKPHCDNLYSKNILLPASEVDQIIKYKYVAEFEQGYLSRYPPITSDEFVLGKMEYQRDLWHVNDSMQAHISDIVFHCKHDIKESLMQLENICKNKLNLQVTLGMISDIGKNINYSSASRSCLLYVAAIGLLISNTEVLCKHYTLDANKVNILLKFIRTYNIKDLPKKASYYMKIAIQALCRIKLNEDYCLLGFVDMSFPFFDMAIFYDFVTKETKIPFCSDRNGMFEVAMRVSKNVMDQYSLYTSSDGDKNRMISQEFLKFMLKNLPTATAVHVFTNCFCSKLNLSVCQTNLQTQIAYVMQSRISRELSIEQKGNNLANVYNLWNLISKQDKDRTFDHEQFEGSIIEMTEKITSQTELTHDLIKSICEDNVLFQDVSTQTALLNGMATSANLALHEAFIVIAKLPKFCSAVECIDKKIFQNWFEKLINTHYKRMGSETKLVYLYTRLSDILSLTIISKSPEICQTLENRMNTELEHYSLEDVLQKLEETLEKKPSAELLLRNHARSLIEDRRRKHKPLRLLSVVCGTDGHLRINSRLTETIAFTLIDVYCSLTENLDEIGMFLSLTENFKFWETILCADGEHVSILKSNENYKKATACINNLLTMFKHNEVKSYHFKQLQRIKETKGLLYCGSCKTSELDQWWNAAENYIKVEQENISTALYVVSMTEKETPKENLPEGFPILVQRLKQCKQYIDDGKQTEEGFKSEILDHMPKVTGVCQLLKPVIGSKVFWNLFKFQNKEYYSKQKNDDIDIESVICDVRFPFDNENPSIQFLTDLVDIGLQLYKDAWYAIQTDPSIGMTKVSYMFNGSFTSIWNEINIAESLLQNEINLETKQTLERIGQIEDITDTVESLKSSLKSFKIDIADDKMFHDAIDSFEKLLHSNSSSHSFGDVKQALDTIFHLVKRLSPKTVAVLCSLGNALMLVEFLQKIVDEDIRNLIDAVEDISEQHVNETTVSALIDVKRYLQPILASGFKRKADNLFQTVNEQVKLHDSVAGNLPSKIVDCRDNLHNLISLYNNVANRGEQTKEIIKNIVTRGEFHFFLIKGKKICDFKATYPTESKEKKESSHSRITLVDLRSRALLLMNTERHDSERAAKNDDLGQFVRLINLCLDVSELVYMLHGSGHINYKTFTITKKSDEMKTLKESLGVEYSSWKENLKEVRDKHYLMNFVQGSQMHVLFSYLEKQNNDAESEVYTLLNFIHPDMKTQRLRETYLEQKKCKGVNWGEDIMLECIGQSLHSAYNGLFRFQRQIFTNEGSDKRLTDVVHNGKLLVVQLNEGSVLVVKSILALYNNTTKQLPEPNQVLFCTNETTWNELNLFLRRCLGAYEFYGDNNLFCITNVEILPNELQFKLVEALRELKKGFQFLLAIVCRGSNSHPFIDELSEFVMAVRPLSDKSVEDIFLKECPNVCAYTSEVAGLGKTNSILTNAHINKRALTRLQISGKIYKRELVERLIKLNVDVFHTLHIDIGSVDNPVELDTFIFELVILRYVSAETVAVGLHTSHIAIEIANTINNYLRNSLQTAMSFERKHIEWKNYGDYIVSREINSPIQVVCNFLYTLKNGELDKKDLYFIGPYTAKALSTSECRDLLRENFNMTNDMSFAVANIFLNVLADQLKKMSSSVFFRTSHITDMTGQKELPTIRSSLVKALIEVSKEFASRSVNACRATQTSTLTTDKVENKQLTATKNISDLATKATQRVESMVRWEDSNHLIYVFHNQNIQTISPMYRDKTKVPDHIKQLFESQMKRDMKDFKTLDQTELQDILQKIARGNPDPLSKEKLDALANDYALTPDNILKMILIMLRIKAHVPIIVMGETGCGKTSLIRYLAAICDVQFVILSIHAGIEEQTVIKRVIESNKKARNDLQKEIWLFLDEINTSECLGLMSDILCHHQCLGQTLAPNLIVMAACNPYKLRSSTIIFTAGLQGKVKSDELSRLVYRVLPLPEMLVDYVWDFGSLSTNDERLYIKQMVANVFKEYSKDHELFADLLSVSQQFVRSEEETACSVSLRDVQRCKILVEWFLKMLPTKVMKCDIYFPCDMQTKAMILALAHCYHSRISDTAIRKQYRQAMEKLFKLNGYTSLDEKNIHEVIKQEQKDILSRMELPTGTAQNTALQENVFVVLICLLTRIPIFVVGKPGCSKSLSMQVIKSNLRGKDSKDIFFKTLPQLYCVSFQGSESSTSDGIIKVFEKAEKYQETNSKEDVLSVVILDEIGLAEMSGFNPLKVLHNLLEPEGKPQPNVAVVGISNWSLDASKMNRAIHLARPDMDEGELYETAISISDSFVRVGNATIFDSIQPTHLFSTKDIQTDLERIAKSYFNYTKALRFENFHGLRDFYSLVKYIAKQLSELTNPSEEEKAEVILMGLERNFGGLPTEKQTLHQNFHTQLKTQIPVIKLITCNIKDPLARHLMLITTGESVIGIVEESLTKIKRHRKEVIFGSQFEEDLTDDYNYRILSRIILCMEQGIVLILKDLENIYGSLYDMLNQNYTVIGKKKNCRVALGPYSNPICHVADTFRCIVLVDEANLNFTDPPFLNRFEKQYLRFADIIDRKQKEVIQYIEEWIEGIRNIKSKHFSSNDVFPIYSEDMVAALILKLDEKTADSSIDTLIKQCKDELMWIICPEAVIRLHESIDENIQEASETIKEKYLSLPLHEGMRRFMKYQFHEADDCNLTDGLMNVVFTNSNIHTKVLYNVTEKKVQVDKLGAFKSEKQLSLRMHQFWMTSEANVLFLQCSAIDDQKHIMLAKSVIERYRHEHKSKHGTCEKHVYLVIHMDRSKGVSRVITQINFLSDWKLTMLDTLECPQTPLPELCKLTLHQAILQKRPLNQYIEKQLFWTFTRIRYTTQGRDVHSIKNILDKMKSSNDFLQMLDDRICAWIIDFHSDICDFGWQVSVACNTAILQTTSSFVEALERHIFSAIDIPLSKTVYQMEVMNILDSYLIIDECSEQRRQLWTTMLDNDMIYSIAGIPNESGPETFICESKDLSLKMPFSMYIYNNIEITRDEFLDSLILLKGKCGLDIEDDLPPEIYQELLLNHENAILMAIPNITGSLYSKFVNDYLEDFCNIASYASCPGLPKSKRIKYVKQAILHKTAIADQEDDHCRLFCQLHTTFWNHCSLFTAELQLLEACKVVLIDEEKIFLPCPLYSHQSDGTENTTEEIFEHLRRPLTPTKKQQKDISSEGTESDHNAPEDEEITDNLDVDDKKDEQIGNTTLKTKDAESQTNFELCEYSSHNPQEILVDSICKKMMPTVATLERYKGITSWQSKVNCVLTLAAQVSQKPKSIHQLRFCNDIAAGLLIPHSLKENALCGIAQLLQQNYDLGNKDVFETLMDILKSAQSINKEECQRILTLYAVRSLAIDSNTDAVHNLLSLVVDGRIPDQSCSLLKSPLQLAIELEIVRNQYVLKELLLSEQLPSNTDSINTFGGTGRNDKQTNTSSILLYDLDYCLRTLCSAGYADSPFVVLLVDLLQDAYSDLFEDQTKWRDIVTENMSHFLNCHQILTGTKFGIRFVAALAYFKTFLQSFGCVQDIGIFMSNTLSQINAVFHNIKDNSTSKSMLLFFLKAMGNADLTSRFMKRCQHLQEKLPFLKDIQWTTGYVRECLEGSPLSIYVKNELTKTQFADTQDAMVYRDGIKCVIKDACNNEQGSVLLFSFAIKQFYIPSSHTVLEDTRKTQALLLMEEALSCHLKDKHVQLLKRLIGRKDFNVPEFQLGEESPQIHVLITVFLSALYGLLLACDTSSSGTMKPVLTKCLFQNGDLQKCFLPGYPENDLQESSIFDVKHHFPGAKFSTCHCGYRLAAREYVDKCIVCDTNLELADVPDEPKDKNARSETGYINSKQMKHIHFATRGLSPVACNILYILTKGCLLGSLALNLASSESTERLTSLPEVDASTILWEDLECHWNNLSTLLNIPVNTVGLLLHTIMHRAKNHLCTNNNPMSSIEERLKWEKQFSDIIDEILQRRFQSICELNAQHIEINHLPSKGVEQIVLELDDINGLSDEQRRTQLSSLFRICSLPTMDNFISELHRQKDEFPFLMLALKHEHTLRLPCHIFNIMQWQIAAASYANYMMKKHECLNMTVAEFIKKCGDVKKKDTVEKRFKAFANSWEILKETSGINCDIINKQTKMAKCLILENESILYQMLNFLVEVQNDFLDKALQLAHLCNAVRFLVRDSNVSVISCVNVSEVNKQHLVAFEFPWQECLQQESQSCLTYGHGRQIIYDFTSIEKALAVDILVGKSYINLSKGIPTIVFSDELYKNYVSLVKELKTKVMQIKLPSDIVSAIKSKKKDNSSMATELLTHIGVIMTLLKKTKGEGETSVIDYAEKWKNILTRCLPNELLPSPPGSIKLCHIVSLHELLEELHADIIIDALEEQFRDPLTFDLQGHFSKLIRNVKVAELLLKAIKMFTHRCLSLREAVAEQSLLSYLSDESFWPEGLDEDGGIHITDSSVIKVVDILPETLMVSQVYATVTFIEEQLEKQQQNDLKMTKLASSWKATHKTSQSTVADRQQKKVTKYKRF